MFSAPDIASIYVLLSAGMDGRTVPLTRYGAVAAIARSRWGCFSIEERGGGSIIVGRESAPRKLEALVERSPQKRSPGLPRHGRRAIPGHALPMVAVCMHTVIPIRRSSFRCAVGPGCLQWKERIPDVALAAGRIQGLSMDRRRSPAPWREARNSRYAAGRCSGS